MSNRVSNKICPEGMDVELWQTTLRREQAIESQFEVSHLDNNRIWGDYQVSSESSKYKVAFRGVRSEKNFCSCLDFRTNGLGTCKHLEAVILHLQQHVPGYPWAGMEYTPEYTSIYVSYKGGRSIRIRVGSAYRDEYMALASAYFDTDGILPEANYHLLPEICQRALGISSAFRKYEDVDTFAQERLFDIYWKQDVQDSYPEGRIPWQSDRLVESTRDLEALLFQLCYRSSSLFVSRKYPLLQPLFLKLIREIYLGEEEHLPSYIVLNTEAETHQWRQRLGKCNELQGYPIEVVTQPQFIELVNNEHPRCTFVYVDDADALKAWKNPLSITIKKLSIAHLYMRIDSLQRLTPVQLSSILQHINPFVIGPYYKFIHTYHPLFPLKDDGSNLPKEVDSSITLGHTLLCREDVYTSTDSTQCQLEAQKVSAEQLVSDLLHQLEHVLSCDEASKLLRQRLRQLLQ